MLTVIVLGIMLTEVMMLHGIDETLSHVLSKLGTFTCTLPNLHNCFSKKRNDFPSFTGGESGAQRGR